jgi:TolA-binding protein
MNKFQKICLLLIFATLASACVKKSSDQDFRNMSAQLNMEQNDRIEADALHRQMLERQTARISRLEDELKELRGVLRQICINNPELCKVKTPAELENWK